MTELRKINELTWPSDSFGRSVNIKIGISSNSDTAPFRFTEKSIRALDQLIDASGNGSRDRAYSIIGPYGSGKSAFALLASTLLSNTATPWSDESLKQLEVVSPDLYKRLNNECGTDKRGYFPIIVQGEKSALDLALCRSLFESITSSSLDTKWVPDELVDSVHLSLQTLETGINSPTDVVELYKRAADHAKAASYKGLIVIADEFGKFLERSAERGDVPDVIAAQYLAELASRTEDAGILFIVLLHQNFRDYASGQTQSQRQEWSKIQGRFKQIDFSEESEDLYSLISACLGRTDSSDEKDRVIAWALSALDQVQGIPLFQGDHKRAFWEGLLPSVYPFHPIALYGLPRLSARLAQNERTLFTFLVSEDPLGLKRFLTATPIDENNLPSLTLDVVVDFFLYGARFSSWSPDIYQSISQLESALERLGDRPDLEKRILKIIGGIRLLKAGPALPCNKDSIRASLGFDSLLSNDDFETILDALVTRKIIVHRRFSDEFHLWEGSDFDFDQAIENIRGEMKNDIDTAGSLPEGFLSRPITANQHTMLTGNTRVFSRSFISTLDCLNLDLEGFLKKETGSGVDGVIIHTSPATAVEVVELQEWAKSIDDDRVVLTVPDSPSHVSFYINDMAAYKTLKEMNPEIQEDPVALKELAAREEGMSVRLEEALSILTDAGPNGPDWWWKGNGHPIRDRKSMNRLFSQIADCLYPDAPKISNELVNRSHLPTAVVIAVKKIIAGLLDGSSAPTLGFEGNGPEVSIFKNVFERTGIYKKVRGDWRLVAPNSKDSSNLSFAWSTIERFLEGANQSEENLSDLFGFLADRPYGLKAGIIPLFVWAVLIHRRDSVCLYYDGTYIKNWDVEIFDLSAKVPSKFTIRWVAAEQSTKTIIRSLSSVLLKDHPKSQRVGVNTILSGLFGWYRNLPEYSRQTRDISPHAFELRKVITSSSDPIGLLFAGIPESLGLQPFLHSGTSKLRSRVLKTQTEQLARLFEDAIHDIDQAYDRLMSSMAADLGKAFSCDSDIKAMSQSIKSSVSPILDFIHDPQTKAFLTRACNEPDQDQYKWVEALGATLTKQAPRYWNDAHVVEWKENIGLLSLAVHDAQKRRFAMQRVNQDTGSIRLLIESSNGNEIERIFEADNKDGDVDKRDEWLLTFLELDRVDSDEAHKRDIQEVLLRALTKTIN